jgi:hypothetical protein
MKKRLLFIFLVWPALIYLLFMMCSGIALGYGFFKWLRTGEDGLSYAADLACKPLDFCTELLR